MNTPALTSLPLHVFKLNLDADATAPTLDECDVREAKVMTRTYLFAIALSRSQSATASDAEVPKSFFQGLADCEEGRVSDADHLLDEQELATGVPV